jgi:hypothetical protein
LIACLLQCVAATDDAGINRRCYDESPIVSSCAGGRSGRRPGKLRIYDVAGRPESAPKPPLQCAGRHGNRLNRPATPEAVSLLGGHLGSRGFMLQSYRVRPYPNRGTFAGAAMTASGQPAKSSRRAYIFRNAPDTCRKRAVPALTISTISSHSKSPVSRIGQINCRAMVPRCTTNRSVPTCAARLELPASDKIEAWLQSEDPSSRRNHSPESPRIWWRQWLTTNPRRQSRATAAPTSQSL